MHFAENALNCPAVGWVTTTPCAAKIFPPPCGMSDVLPSTPPASLPPPFPAGLAPSDPPALSEPPPQAVSAAASPAAPTHAMTVRRAGTCTGTDCDSVLMLTVLSTYDA